MEVANKITQAPKGTPDAIDGIMDSAWDSSLFQPCAVDVKLGSLGVTAPDSPADFSGGFRTLWDETGLYIFISVTDDVFQLTTNNGFYVYTSSAYTRNFGEYANSGYDGLSDAHIMFQFGSSNKVVHGLYSYGSGAEIPEITLVTVPTAAGYDAEAKIPWSVILGSGNGVNFENGVFIGGPDSAEVGDAREFLGFEVVLQDEDGGDDRDHKLAWFGGPPDRVGNFAWADTQVWGTLELTNVSTANNSPLPPTNVDASDGIYPNTVQVSWTSSIDTTSYKVYRNTTDDSNSATQLISVQSSSPYDDTTVTPGTTYYYWVKATNSFGDSGFSASNSGYASSSAFAQPLAQEQFIIGAAGVGYTADLNMIKAEQNTPSVTSPVKAWWGAFDRTDADGIANRFTNVGANSFLSFNAVANSLNLGSLAAKGAKLMVATGGIGFFAELNTALDGPLGAYSTDGTLLDKDGTTLYISYLYKLNNLNVGANQNVIDFIDGINTTRAFDNTSQDYMRNYTNRYSFGQNWGTATISNLIPIDTATHLVVMKIEFKAGNDTLNLFLDPDSTLPEAQNVPDLANSSRNMTFNAISLRAQQVTANTTGFMFDELRFGSTWESVVPQAARYTLTIGAADHGTVSKVPDAADYPDGTDVILTATPAAGYKFSTWTGDVAEADKTKAQITVTMSANKTITPSFILIPDYTINATVNPLAGGSVQTDPGLPVKEGTDVEITAVPATGYMFVNWSIGGQTFSSNPISRTLTADLDITANFVTTTIVLDPTSATIPAAGGQFSFMVNTDLNWTAVKVGSFITLSTTSGTSVNNTLTYTIAENTTNSERTGTITVRESGNNSNNKVFSITQSAFSAPQNVNASDGTYTDKVQVTWTGSAGATSYKVYRNTIDDSNSATQVVSAQSSSPYDDTTVTSGTTYFYWVKATNSGLDSEFSASNSGYAASMMPPIDIANKVATASKIEAPSVKPVIDGEMDDVWKNAPEYDLNSFIRNGTQYTEPSGPGDISGKWRALWDATNLYLYLDVMDDTLVFAPFNDFEAYISTSYTRNFGEWHNSGYDLNDAMIFWDLGDDPVKGVAGLYSVYSSVNFPGTVTSVKATATGYVAEVSITWAALNDDAAVGVTWDPDSGKFLGGPSEYEERDFIGFELMLQDDDDGTFLDTKVAWYGGPDDRHGDFAWADTQVWGTLKLTSASTSYNPPHAPTNIAPANNAMWQSLTPTLQSSAFSSPDAGTTHTSSQWVVYDSSGTNEVWNSGEDTTNKVSITLPAGKLTDGTTYQWQVKHKDNNGAWSYYSTKTSFTTIINLPFPPINVNASDGTYPNKVQVSWTSSIGATSYKVYRNTSNDSNSATQLISAQVSSPYDDTTATPGTTYYYWVKGTNSFGDSEFSASNTGYAGTSAGPPIDVANKLASASKIEAPSVKPVIDGEMDEVWLDAPEYDLNSYIPAGTNLTPPSGPGDISAKWRALWDATNLYLYLDVMDDTLVFTPLNDFEVYISTSYTRNFGEWANSGYDINDAQIFWDLGASPVKAVAGLYSVYSQTDFPGTVTAVKATATGYVAEVSITWAALNQDTALGVTWDPDSGKFLGGPSEYNERDFIGFELMLQDDDDGAPRDTRVAWYGGPDDRHGDFAWADTQVWGTLKLTNASTANNPPANVNASDGTYTNKVQVTWNSSIGATSYKVYRNTTDEPNSAIQLISGQASSPYDDTTVTPGTTYYYWVKATSSGVDSGFSVSNTGYAQLPVLAQPLAQEQFIIGAAGVGYTADLNMIKAEQNTPLATSPVKAWWGAFDKTDADGIANRYSNESKDGANPFLPFYTVTNSLNIGSLVAKGGKLLVATGNVGYFAQLNTALDGPLGAYSTDGTLLDKDGTTLYISYLYKLNNLNIGANQNIIDFVDGVNTTRTFDNTSQAYVRNYAGRFNFGQAWGSDNISNLITIDTATHLVVMKIEFKTGNDILNLFLDPDSTLPEAQNVADVANNSRNMTFNALRFTASQTTANTTGYMFDELRFGSTWESVVPQAGRYTLTIGAADNGTVSKAPDAVDYINGTDVTVTATPAAGYKFSAWTGDVAEADKAKPQITVSVNANMTITPSFILIPDYTINATVNPVAGGSVQTDPGLPVKEGTEVEITAVPATGYKFVNWSIGGQNFSSNPISRTLTANLDITANFVATAIALDPTFATIPAAGGQFSFMVNTDLDWVAVKVGSFITLSTTNGTPVNNTVTYTIANNTTSSQRTGTITVRESGNNSNYKEFSVTQAAFTPPQNVNASDGAYTNKVQVTWTDSVGATSYKVYRNTIDDSNSATQLLSGQATSPYDDTAVTPGITYYYWVKATNSGGDSEFGASNAGFAAFTPPQNVNASDGTYTNKVQVTWTGSIGATSYKVYRNTSDDSNSAIQIISALASSPYDDTTVTPGTTYYYWVKASNSGLDSEFSASNSGYAASDVNGSATHTSLGYSPGHTATVSVTISATGVLDTSNGLGYTAWLPEGWSFLSDDTTTASAKPGNGDVSEISWLWITPPALPYTFSISIAVPSSTSGEQSISGEVYFTNSQGRITIVRVSPDPLPVSQLFYHASDTNQDWKISLAEVLRVIALYNYRETNVRTGEYHCESGSVDGFNPGPGDQTCIPHSVDYNPIDWKLSLPEVLRLITLYNYRNNNQRTGDYHRDELEGDGYAPGPVPSPLNKLSASPIKMDESSLQEANGYTAAISTTSTALESTGGTLDINVQLTYASLPSAMGLSIALPSGWSYISDDAPSTGGKPLVGQEGNLEWLWITMPGSPINYTVSVQYPPNLSNEQTIEGIAQFFDSEGTQFDVALSAIKFPLASRSLRLELTEGSDFGSIATGTSASKPLVINNDGNSEMTVSSINYPDGFSGNWNGGKIVSGGNQTVTVQFNPTIAASYNGTITVISDHTSGVNTTTCSGSGYIAATAPTVITGSVTNITTAGANTGGTVTVDGGANILQRGVVYSSINSNPTTDNSPSIVSGTGTGTFTVILSGLTAGTKYYVRGYAINSKGTAYGSIETFTTLVPITVPTVSTLSLIDITETGATAGGNVTADGGASVTQRGVVYSSTTTNPTTDNSTWIASGSGIGKFSVSLDGLTAGTLYYVRAFAINTQGTAYGNMEILSTKVSMVFYDSPTTYDLGGGWKWNTLYGYGYSGFHPFIYVWDTAEWISVVGTSESEGYFFFRFTEGHWGWSAPEFYPYYVEFPSSVYREWNEGKSVFDLTTPAALLR